MALIELTPDGGVVLTAEAQDIPEGSIRLADLETADGFIHAMLSKDDGLLSYAAIRTAVPIEDVDPLLRNRYELQMFQTITKNINERSN